MTVLFVNFSSTLPANRLATHRRRLAHLLGSGGVSLRTIPKGNVGTLLTRMMPSLPGAVVVLMDDAHSDSAKCPAVVQLAAATADLLPARRPAVIYLTEHPAGIQLPTHPLIHHTLQRDDKGRWVGRCAELAASLVAKGAVASAQSAEIEDSDGLVGASPVFRDAVASLTQILSRPYGMVSGEAGVGKMHLLRELWPRVAVGAPFVVLACGTFFEDYYDGRKHRRIGGGRKSVDQLAPYLDEAEDGLLVLHHVELLPSALQEEFAARLSAPSKSKVAYPVVGVDSKGLNEKNIRIVATSVYTPEFLQQSGRLNVELARKLARYHVRIPSLAERGPDDVARLCPHLLRAVALRNAPAGAMRGASGIDPGAVRALARHAWPGNTGDLLRAIERAHFAAGGATVLPRHLPREVSSRPPASRRLDDIIDSATRSAIVGALREASGDVGRAAVLLGRNKAGLYRLMRKVGLDVRAVDM